MRGLSVVFLLALIGCNNAANGGNPPAATATPSSSNVAAAPAPGGTIAAATPVASWDGGALTYGDVTTPIASELSRLQAEYLTNRYETELGALEQALNDKILEAEAKKRKLADVKALLQAEVSAKVPAPTEEEVQALYASAARRIGKPLEEVRPDVEQAVRQRKESERFQTFMTELRTAYKASITLPYPDLPRADVSVDDDPSVGPADAAITIIQFAEYQCPYCGKAREAIDQVMKDYDGKVRFVFRDFPLNFHDRAIPAAVAANCAAKQDPAKYWKVHDALMANQRALQEPDLERAAVDAGVDLAKWKSCRTEVAMEDEVRKDLEDGQKHGVTGTPAFFINGIFLNGAQPYEKFKTIIDRELAKKG